MIETFWTDRKTNEVWVEKFLTPFSTDDVDFSSTQQPAQPSRIHTIIELGKTTEDPDLLWNAATRAGIKLILQEEGKTSSDQKIQDIIDLRDVSYEYQVPVKPLAKIRHHVSIRLDVVEGQEELAVPIGLESEFAADHLGSHQLLDLVNDKFQDHVENIAKKIEEFVSDRATFNGDIFFFDPRVEAENLRQFSSALRNLIKDNGYDDQEALLIRLGVTEKFKISYVDAYSHASTVGKSRSLRKTFARFRRIPCVDSQRTVSYIFHGEEILKWQKKSEDLVEFIGAFTKPLPLIKPKHLSGASVRNMINTPEGLLDKGKFKLDEITEKFQKPLKSTRDKLQEETNHISSGVQANIYKLRQNAMVSVDTGFLEEATAVTKNLQSLNQLYDKVFNRFDITSTLREAVLCIEDKLPIEKVREIRRKVEESRVMEDVEKAITEVENAQKGKEYWKQKLPVPPTMPKPPTFFTFDPQSTFSKELYRVLQLAFLLTMLALLKSLLQAIADECKNDPAKNPINPEAFDNNPGAYDDLEDKFDEKTISELKDLLPDLASILSPYELCSLMEQSAEQETLELVDSLIRVGSYPSLQEKIQAMNDIEGLFSEIAQSFGPSFCEKILSGPDNEMSLNDLCSGAEAASELRAKLLQKKCLDPSQIKEQLDLLQKAREQKYEQLLTILADPSSLFEGVNAGGCGGNGIGAQPEVTPAMKEMADKTIDTLFEGTRMSFSSDISGLRLAMFEDSTSKSAMSENIKIEDARGSIEGEVEQSDRSVLPKVRAALNIKLASDTHYSDVGFAKVIDLPFMEDDIAGRVSVFLQEQLELSLSELDIKIQGKDREYAEAVNTQISANKSVQEKEPPETLSEAELEAFNKIFGAILEAARQELKTATERVETLSAEIKQLQEEKVASKDASVSGQELISPLTQQALTDTEQKLSLTLVLPKPEFEGPTTIVYNKQIPNISSQEEIVPVEYSENSVSETFFSEFLVNVLKDNFGGDVSTIREYFKETYSSALLKIIQGEIDTTYNSSIFHREQIDGRFDIDKLQFIPPQDMRFKRCEEKNLADPNLLGLDNAKLSMLSSLSGIMCPDNTDPSESSGGGRLSLNQLEEESIRNVIRVLMRIYLIEYYFKSACVWQGVNAQETQEPEMFRVLAESMVRDIKTKYSLGKFEYYSVLYEKVMDFYNYLIKQNQITGVEYCEKDLDEIKPFSVLLQREWSDVRSDFDQIMVDAGIKVADVKTKTFGEEFVLLNTPRAEFADSLKTPRILYLDSSGSTKTNSEFIDKKFFVEYGVFARVPGIKRQYWTLEEFRPNKDVATDISFVTRLSYLLNPQVESANVLGQFSDVVKFDLNLFYENKTNSKFVYSERLSDDVSVDIFSIPLLETFENIAGPDVLLNLEEKYRDLDRSVKSLANQPVFKLWFEKCFPLALINSFVSLYVSDSVDNLYDAEDLMSPTKFELKRVFGVLMSGGDPYYSDPDIDEMGGNAGLSDMATSGAGKGTSIAKSITKMIAETPLLILKGLAKITDPNIAISSQVQQKLKDRGVRKSLKSIAMPLAFAIPLTPWGLMYLGLDRDNSNNDSKSLVSTECKNS